MNPSSSQTTTVQQGDQTFEDHSSASAMKSVVAADGAVAEMRSGLAARGTRLLAGDQILDDMAAAIVKITRIYFVERIIFNGFRRSDIAVHCGNARIEVSDDAKYGQGDADKE